MALAMTTAREAKPDVPVGALVVDGAGKILSLAANRVERDADPTAHAEIAAIRAACAAHGSPQLPGHVLVVTLEPCLMCLGAIAHARLSGVVFGAWDARAGALCSLADHVNLPLAGHKLWHLGGILAEPCARLLQDFFQKRR